MGKGGNPSVRIFFQWVSHILNDDDKTAAENFEQSLATAGGFEELNDVIDDGADIALDWWPTSPGGRHEDQKASRTSAMPKEQTRD